MGLNKSQRTTLQQIADGDLGRMSRRALVQIFRKADGASVTENKHGFHISLESGVDATIPPVGNRRNGDNDTIIIDSNVARLARILTAPDEQDRSTAPQEQPAFAWTASPAQ